MNPSLLLAALLVQQPPAEPPPAKAVLTVRPAPAPVPSLRYRLLPELRDLTPGNAATQYYAAFADETRAAHRPQNYDLTLERWAKVPLDVLPTLVKQQATPNLETLNARWLREIDRAARRSHCDWELLPRIRAEGIGVILHNVQPAREAVRLLKLRARLELAEGRTNDCVRTLQTMLALGRDVAETPTLINLLVGIAITAITVEAIDEFIQQPGAPNLYWALSDLRTPYFDLRRTMQGERLFVDAQFPGVRDRLLDPTAPPLDKVPNAEKFLQSVAGDDGLGAQLMRMAAPLQAALIMPEAKRILAAYGWTEKQIEGMKPTEAFWLVQIANYDRHFDDLSKWIGLPYPVAEAKLEAITREFQQKPPSDVGSTLAKLMVPAVQKVVLAHVRINRRLALLRTVEAIRLHMAANGGQLPAKLADITLVPVPTDPRTGKAFEYQVENGVGMLFAPPPPGQSEAVDRSWRYELKPAK